MTKNFNKQLGLRIRELRIRKNLKQGEMAEILNMERSNFTRIESARQRSNDENLEKISKILNVEIKDPLDFEHKKPQKDQLREIIEN